MDIFDKIRNTNATLSSVSAASEIFAAARSECLLGNITLNQLSQASDVFISKLEQIVSDAT